MPLADGAGFSTIHGESVRSDISKRDYPIFKKNVASLKSVTGTGTTSTQPMVQRLVLGCTTHVVAVSNLAASFFKLS